MYALDAGDARAAVVVSLLRKIYAIEAQARADGVDRETVLCVVLAAASTRSAAAGQRHLQRTPC